MSALLVGYAPCSTDAQDLTAQRDALGALGVAADGVPCGDARGRHGGFSTTRGLSSRTADLPFPPQDGLAVSRSGGLLEDRLLQSSGR